MSLANNTSTARPPDASENRLPPKERRKGPYPPAVTLSWRGGDKFRPHPLRRSYAVTARFVGKYGNDAFGASTAVSAAANAHVGALYYKDAFNPIGVKDFNDIRFMQLTTDAEETDELVTTLTTKEDAYVCFKNVQFSEREATLVAFRANAANSTTRVAVYLDGLYADAKVAESDNLPEGWNTTTLSIPPTTGTHTAYLVLLASGKVAFHSVWFGDATAMHSIEDAGHSRSSVVSFDSYDLSGRQLIEQRKGIFIVGGQKILVR